MAIKHILFDADGVIQDASTHWQPGLHSVLKLGDEAQAKAVLQDVFAAESAVLEVNGGFAEELEAVLSKWERKGMLAEALSVIHAIEVKQDVMRVVQDIRSLGIRCHIASNQQTSRAQRMSEGLNYSSLFDTEFYSCFIGAAKPKLSFFEKVVARLGCDPSAVLFIDDRVENVEAAKKAGLNAVAYFGSSGAPLLREHLARFGVFVAH